VTPALGEVAALFRYPIKSMRGESVDSVGIGWHGLDGDRRLALRRLDDRGGFPWLTASKLPALLCFTPLRVDAQGGHDLPTHVRTPEGETHSLFGPDLALAIGRRYGSPVEMMHLSRGIFDEASVSLITSATVDAVSQLASVPTDVRRFRPNILLHTCQPIPFEEDGWVGGILWFGLSDDGPAVLITNRDERCAMVSYDPDSAQGTPELLRAIARERRNQAGVYATVLRPGRLHVGQPIRFAPVGAQVERA
jgi:hypothetical protein